jgi:hypothetical protein
MFPDIRIIDEIGVNERTIVSWYDKAVKAFSFGIFHISKQPNIQSKLSAYTNWGYLVYIAPAIEDHVEAAEVYDLFLMDLIKEDYWFEDDSNFEIPQEMYEMAKDLGIDLDKPEVKVNTKPKFVLIKNEVINDNNP